jgi:hypothetical protein
MNKYYGWWCPWCSTWVDKKDTEVRDGQRFHKDCDNVVDRRQSNKPVVPTPPDADVVAEQEAYHKSLADFARDAK